MTELERKLLAENEQLQREVDVLRQNSTAEIEFVDETHAKFNGQIFAKTKKGHFYRAVSLHEAVWRFHFGNIPEGYVIHHINGDKPFCDGQCWNRYIHANKIYYEECTCVICGKKFSVYKYRKTKTCSDACHYKLLSLSKGKKKS